MPGANYSIKIDEDLKRRFEDKVERQYGGRNKARVIRSLIREYVNKDDRKQDNTNSR